MDEGRLQRILESKKLILPPEAVAGLQAESQEGFVFPPMLVELQADVTLEALHKITDLPVVLAQAPWEQPVPGLGCIALMRPSLAEMETLLDSPLVRLVQWMFPLRLLPEVQAPEPNEEGGHP